MARLFCIPGALLIFAAFVLNFIVSISLPYLPALDISRTHFDELALEDGQNVMTQLRFGIWSPCYYNRDDDHTCSKTGYAYSVTVADPEHTNEVTISSSWTRGLAVHPVATAVSLVALTLSLSENTVVALVAFITAWLASFLTFISWLIDIILYAWAKHQFNKLDVSARTVTAPGLWVTFVSFILLFLGGLSVFFGRLRDRRAHRKAVNLEAATRTKEAEAAAAAADATHEKEVTGASQIPPVTPAVQQTQGFMGKLKDKFGKKTTA